jgi:hypothetical protein
MKISKPFEFEFPVTQKLVRNLRVVTECVGNLQISGMAYMDPYESILSEDRYGFDFDYIKWNGVDVRPLLEAIGDMNLLAEATLSHAAYVFEAYKEAI